MKIIKPSVKLIYITPNAEQHIEKAGRICYKSESKITKDSANKFIKMIIKRGHTSVLEHGVASLRFVCDRGILAEITRTRIASFSVESTRYCDYADKDIEFIEPCFWKNDRYKMKIWEEAMLDSEKRYQALRGLLASPQEARSVLPNSLKTEIVMTTNFRSWKNFFKLRCAKDAHIQIQEVANMAFNILSKECPVVFMEV